MSLTPSMERQGLQFKVSALTFTAEQPDQRAAGQSQCGYLIDTNLFFFFFELYYAECVILVP